MAWQSRFLAARRGQHGRVIAEKDSVVKNSRVHPTHWLISTQVGCLIRLEMNEAAGAFRLTVRTAVPHVSTALAEAIQKLL